MVKYLIIGAKGKITQVEELINSLSEWAKKRRLLIQAFDADLVYGKSHLISALEHALRAMKEKRNFASTLALETLLYSSGKRQISDAIKCLGIKEGKNKNIALLFVSLDLKGFDGELPLNEEVNKLINSLGLSRTDQVIKGNIEKLYRFGLTKEELESIPKEKRGDLILERVAMVDVWKS
jgi:KEOPS complex subunit Cgi121